MSKLGILRADILIHGGLFKPHHGSDDTVLGKVVLRYEPDDSGGGTLKKNAPLPTAELFGHLRMDLTIRGQVETLYHDDRDQMDFYSETMDLLADTFTVFDESLRAKEGHIQEIEWFYNFPDSLPPTFSATLDRGNCTVNITYFAECSIFIAGINVKTKVPTHGSRPAIHHDTPRPQKALVQNSCASFTTTGTIQSERLLPGHEHARGFKQKAKLLFASPSHFPQLVISVKFSYPDIVCPGLIPEFAIVLDRDPKSTATSLPEASLQIFSADLVAWSSVSRHDSHMIVGSVPFNGALTFLRSRTNDGQSTAIVSPDWNIPSIASTFQHSRASRSYVWRIKVRVEFAGKTIDIKKECPVQAVPTPLDSEPITNDTASPATEPELSPPSYKEAAMGL